jgi:hypothetical protein
MSRLSVQGIGHSILREGKAIRHFLLLALLLTLSGCKTAEFAVQHPISGPHVVAKFESPELQAYLHPDSPAKDDCSHQHAN